MPSRRSHYGPIQLADRLGLRAWQVDRARTLGLIPAPDLNGRRWSAALVEPLADRVPEILAAVGAHPGVGANRAAEQLAERTGIAGVHRSDVEALAERRLLRVVGSYKDWPLYDLAELQALPCSSGAMDALRELVTDRQAWLAASLSARDAAERLGWRLAEFERAVAERGLRPGRFGRYLAADVEALGQDLELAEQVAAERLAGPDQAAEHLEIRRTDFDYMVAAGWVRPAAWTEIQVGRRRWVSLSLYRTGDLNTVRDLPDIDWESVRSCRPGDPSPLHAFAPRQPSRAQLIHRFTATLAARHHTQVWAVYDGSRDRWRLGWEPGEHSQPTLLQVAAAIAADPAIGLYRDELTLDPPDQEVNP
jgi:hypothetical protein